MSSTENNVKKDADPHDISKCMRVCHECFRFYKKNSLTIIGLGDHKIGARRWLIKRAPYLTNIKMESDPSDPHHPFWYWRKYPTAHRNTWMLLEDKIQICDLCVEAIDNEWRLEKDQRERLAYTCNGLDEDGDVVGEYNEFWDVFCNAH